MTDDLGAYFVSPGAQAFLKGKVIERLRGNLAAITGCGYCYRKNGLHFDWCRWESCAHCGHNYGWHGSSLSAGNHCRLAVCTCPGFEARHG